MIGELWRAFNKFFVGDLIGRATNQIRDEIVSQDHTWSHIEQDRAHTQQSDVGDDDAVPCVGPSC